jgi:folate-dependent phosphoribosylglycinamide formyltransferase PurN
MKWVALFSQTGSEIYEISKRLGRFPDYVVTNKQGWEGINQDLINNTVVRYVDSKPSISDYKNHLSEDAIVTLNGWLRIVPPEICDKYEIYNGHPGLITKYPELKGKDPQLKAIELGHLSGGCVIHEATAVLDDGPIVAISNTVCFNGLTEDQVFEDLHKASVYMWENFLKEKLKI